MFVSGLPETLRNLLSDLDQLIKKKKKGRRKNENISSSLD